MKTEAMKTAATATANDASVPVLITTQHRGVFFAYASPAELEQVRASKSLRVRAARNVLYWPTAQKGFIGLAERGPVAGSRVGPAADAILFDVTSILSASPVAVEAFEKAPWSA